MSHVQHDGAAARPTPTEVNDFLVDAFPGSANECVEIGAASALARRLATPDVLRPGGFISGPTQFGLADAVLWYALFGAVGIEPMALTSELSIRFLRPAVGEVLWARADLHQVGRRNVVGSVVVWVDDRTDKPVAVAQGTYVRPG
jgi:acyl-coenzyme A thioesterase PaaI-like protein